MHLTSSLAADPTRAARHDAAAWHLRQKRDRAAAQVPDWEQLREHASALRAHVLDHLPALLAHFIAQAKDAGWTVHCAAEREDLNRIVHGLLMAHGATRVVKSKSMLTEECGLNHYLEARGIDVTDTDLGERIVQLRHEPPSHLVIPAIHLSRQEVGETFHTAMGTPAGLDDPVALTEAARQDLRGRFLAAEAGITGVNFAVAETGAIVLCTNEGNADLGTALPPLHIACMGVEKLIPRTADLAPLLRLLARSATGQPITAFTSILRGPDPTRPGHQAHLVILDGGRSVLLADAEHREALACIRCGACLNTCPVYRRLGGHAYGTTVAGPIGSVLAPALSAGLGATATALPFASTLCGSCSNVCPVRIDLHGQLLSWRRRLSATRQSPWAKRWGMRVAAWALARPWLYATGGRITRGVWPLLRRRWPGNPLHGWLAGRELPAAPGSSFRAQWKREQQEQSKPSGERDHG
jgi:L-lactate dehydrogenase complex protein LldF